MFKLLQTSAFVFGLSLADAITGFVIFAVGDSLADFSDAIISIVTSCPLTLASSDLRL